MAKQVMIADDDKNYRETIFAQMEYFCDKQSISAEFHEASNGKELVDSVRAHRYDLIFTDNIMPELHGLLAIKQIRDFDKDVPIYMLSSSEVGENAIILGANGYFDKMKRDNFKSGIEAAIMKHLK